MRLRINESIDGALRRFKKLCERSGIKRDMRRKRFYEKPSSKRRRADLKRLKKIRQAQAAEK